MSLWYRMVGVAVALQAVAPALARGAQPGWRMATLRCVADTNLSSYEGESALNYGASTRLRLKGIQMLALFRFDPAPVRGWHIARATLRVRYAGADRKLRKLGFSTVAGAWREGTGAGSAATDGCSFDRLAPPAGRWGVDGVDFTDASFGMAGTQAAYADIREAGDGWIEVEVPRPVLLAALRNGNGLAVTDEKGQTSANNDIYSREQAASQPALIIEGQPGREDLEPAPSVAEPTAPRAPGNPPAAPLPAARPGGGWRTVTPTLRVRAVADTERPHPVTAALRARAADGLWDGARVTLAAARGEVVAFQLLFEAPAGRAEGIVVEPPARFEPVGPGRRWQARTWLSRLWSVQGRDWAPEYCVPLAGPFAIPWGANKIPGQRAQSVLVEALVPANAQPGRYRADLRVRQGVTSVTLPVMLDINALRMPDALAFDVSLNTYGPVSRVWEVPDETPRALALERAYHRAAHLHRATLASLGYSHGGDVNAGYAPPITGSGAGLTVTDWSAWDARWGPYLSGAAFAGLPRGRTPVTHLYLPVHEAWPTDIRRAYSFRAGTTAYPDAIIEHALHAPPIEQALPAAFGDALAAAARAYEAHLAAKGWRATRLHCYLNNKFYYRDPAMGGRGTSWWLLDEPNHRDDWLALAYFARNLRRGRNPGSPILFREDCSRPQWQRQWLDGLVDLMVVSGELYRRPALIEALRRRCGAAFWTYGEASPPEADATQDQAWCVRAWLAGADGVVPWQTVGGEAALGKPDATALLVPGRRFGLEGPVCSLRLKALRRGQQDAEYLAALARSRGWTRGQVGAALAGALARAGARVEDDRCLPGAAAAFAAMRAMAARLAAR